ncbi:MULTISPECIES: NAD-dependent epimerase/dehydratase family protein [Methylosinus]|uniref:NAD(P)-dependent oxidoreductase n=1 Tax=Methylosinus trichosporium (strain ATCC 35070 / NCIMB 11131 / UNIQEM 75 / OB3b) TaxID=595536 RepID=A0A2D2CWL8_METT3|nr:MULTISPECIES: NAD(P)-dependent oxidoreductase [Methylosinus]ATQ67137.1 NAD(P)-dependent oxidoreductase [Methylosinus trichosporium OB3b]
MSKTIDAPVLITGGAGFFGSLLVERLIAEGEHCVVVDLQRCDKRHERLTAIEGDIRDAAMLDRLCAERRFKTIYHCAAMLAHAVEDKTFLWESNVDGTRNVAEAAARHGVRALVFLSSNCLWAENMGRPVREDDEPAPVEIYGKSKWEGEKILAGYADRLNVVSIRCPTIIDEGRLGLLAILFEFIAEGRKVWVVGGGRNRYQFIYAQDLIAACIAAADYPGSEVFNIGSDNVETFREVYGSVIARAGTRARVASLPRRATLFAMRLAHTLGVSPLGPYQYRMIAEDFVFDTSKIKAALQWRPTLSNADMLWLAYRYFEQHRAAIQSRRDVSAHKQAARMGVIRLLKWVS